MMRPRPLVALALALAALLVVTLGCQRTVEVQTGLRVECPYGHVDESALTTVKVPANTAGAYRVRTERRVCDKHVRLEALYAEAQAAIAAGDLDAARAKLAQVTAEDPRFRSAPEQLQQLERGQKPKPDADSDTPASKPATVAPKPGEGDTSGPVGSLAKYAPDALRGYTAEPPSTDALSLSRQYKPTGSTMVLSVVIAVEQYRTPVEAKNALSAVMDPGYAQDAATQKVGAHTVRLGSDGRSFAAAGFTDGAIVVVVEMAAKTGVDPKGLIDDVRDVIEQLP